ncbi:hypothetical protein V1318_10790 [Lysobacter sp. CCNWLW3]|uniref:hypothetical protein n=1 Tax=unclassified Lysobacter TaxID=2635362 RepID=UPI002FD41ABE
MKKIVLLMAFVAHASVAQAQDPRAAATAEYQACLKESEQAREECFFGGCGNILGACYERQIAVIEQDSARVYGQFQGSACAESAGKIDAEFSGLEDRLAKLQQFDGTWSGFELRVELAAAKNKSFKLLASDCPAAGKVR